jgi:hypothetical protein
MKAAAIAIEYGLPRLAVTASIHGGDFADQLERALKREARRLLKRRRSVKADDP